MLASSESPSTELLEAGTNGVLVGRPNPFQAYGTRMEDDARASTGTGSPPVEECRNMWSSQLATDFCLGKAGCLLAEIAPFCSTPF